MSKCKQLLERYHEADLNSMGEQPTAVNPLINVDGKKKKKVIDNTVVVVEDANGDTSKVEDSVSNLQIGLEVEKEHTQTLTRLARILRPDISLEELEQFIADGIEMIATDHIKEYDRYYSEFLNKLEAFLEEQD